MAEAEIEHIYDTEAYRTLNHLIDRKIVNLQQSVVRIRLAASRFIEKPDRDYSESVTVRVSYDKGGRKEFNTGISVRDAENLNNAITEFEQIRKEIRSLQDMKLELANDWDWTHGDSEVMVEIFGENRRFKDVEPPSKEEDSSPAG